MGIGIRDSYSTAHEESMSYDDPYGHMLQKYRSGESSPFGQSPYFRSDMSRPEWDWTSRRERAML